MKQVSEIVFDASFNLSCSVLCLTKPVKHTHTQNYATTDVSIWPMAGAPYEPTMATVAGGSRVVWFLLGLNFIN